MIQRMYAKEGIENTEKQNIVFKNLLRENGGNFFYYMNMINLEKEDPLILSPIHHYYYDYNELKKVKTIIQIKELNKVSDIKKFLSNVSHVLTPGTNFIGCFKDNKIHKSYIQYNSKTINWILTKINSNVQHYLSRKKVIDLLNKYNLEIVDMTEFDLLTYFYVKRK